MTQETVPHIWTSVQIDDDAIRLDLKRGHHHAVARSRGLPFFIDNLLILLGARGEIAIGFKRQDRPQREHPVRKPLLGLQVADQLAPAALCHGLVRELHPCGRKICLDASRRRLLANRKYLRGERRDRHASKREQSPSRKPRRAFHHLLTVRCASHGRILIAERVRPFQPHCK